MSQSGDRGRPLGQTAGSEQRPARQLIGRSLHFDLGRELASLKAEPSWQQGDRNARTLVEGGDYRLVLTALKKGTLVREHGAPGWVSVQTIEGHVRLRLDNNEVYDVPAGQVLVLQPKVRHDVEAVEESVFLLSVAGLSHTA